MRRRLLVSMVLVTALAVTLFGVPLALAAGRIYRSREISRLQQVATAAAGTLPATGLQQRGTIKLPTAPRNIQIGLYDVAGRLVVGTGPPVGRTEVTAAIGGQVADDHDGQWLSVAVPLRDEEQTVGAARAAMPWDVVEDETWRSWLVMAAFGALGTALAGVLAWWQSTRLVAPVEGVTDLASRLGDGDFGARLVSSGIPEIDRAAEALNRTASRLGDLIARERAFTADVSHQLNTPLTSLRLELESALVTPGANLPSSIVIALGEVDRLQATVSTLLAVARDTLRSESPTCDVAEVCLKVSHRFGPVLQDAGRRLSRHVCTGLPAVQCPGNVLYEILSVLVDNARVHGRGAVALSARPAGKGVVIDVTDEGQGIERDPRRIFERRSPDAAGHGIGLALARSLAEAHGARLELSRAAPAPIFTVALAGAPSDNEMD